MPSRTSSYGSLTKTDVSSSTAHRPHGKPAPTGGFTGRPGAYTTTYTSSHGYSPPRNETDTAYAQTYSSSGSQRGRAPHGGFTYASAQGGGYGEPEGYQAPARTKAMAADTWMTVDPSVQTMVAPDAKGKLENALDNLSVSGHLFLGKFEILSSSHRREGGQGLVQVCLVSHMLFVFVARRSWRVAV